MGRDVRYKARRKSRLSNKDRIEAGKGKTLGHQSWTSNDLIEKSAVIKPGTTEMAPKPISCGVISFPRDAGQWALFYN